MLKPFYQGKLDTFCAIYAVLNALRLTHGIARCSRGGCRCPPGTTPWTWRRSGGSCMRRTYRRSRVRLDWAFGGARVL